MLYFIVATKSDVLIKISIFQYSYDVPGTNVIQQYCNCSKQSPYVGHLYITVVRSILALASIEPHSIEHLCLLMQSKRDQFNAKVLQRTLKAPSKLCSGSNLNHFPALIAFTFSSLHALNSMFHLLICARSYSYAFQGCIHIVQ